MAIKGSTKFRGITVPECYVRVMTVHGGKFNGWQCEVFAYANEAEAAPFEEPGPSVETGEYARDSEGEYLRDGDDKLIRETIQQPGVMRINEPLFTGSVTIAYVPGANPITLAYIALKAQEQFAGFVDC